MTAELNTQPEVSNGSQKILLDILRVLTVLVLLYIFLSSVGMMGAGFKTFGKGFAKALISTTSNPLVGLFIGVFATAIVQSSSTTTSMVVAFVASGTLDVPSAIPVVMGANIGTTVTAALVSLGHITRKREFYRAYRASTVHDFFNLLSVMVMLPIELVTRYFFGQGILERSATFLSSVLWGTSSVTFDSPIKMITKPPTTFLKTTMLDVFEFSKVATGTVLVVLGIALLIVSLAGLSKVMKTLMIEKLEKFFEKSIGRSAILGIFIGIVFTTIVQSSSVTTSLMVPMAAAGIMTIEQVFPVTLGANIGTTVTALLASLAGNSTGLTIALVHLLFNLSGILIFFVPAPMRKLPLYLSKRLALAAMKKKRYAVIFIGTVFFLIPGLMIFVSKLF